MFGIYSGIMMTCMKLRAAFHQGKRAEAVIYNFVMENEWRYSCFSCDNDEYYRAHHCSVTPEVCCDGKGHLFSAAESKYFFKNCHG